MTKLLSSLLETVWIYSLLVWGYVVASILDPITFAYQFGPFSRYVPIPTDLVGLIAFTASAVSFALWKWKNA